MSIVHKHDFWLAFSRILMYISSGSTKASELRKRNMSLLTVFNPVQHTVLDILRSVADTREDAEFLVVDRTVALTYAECRTLAEDVLAPRLLSQLDSVRFKHGPLHSAAEHQPPRIVVLASNGPLVPLLYWAAWHLGAVVCPFSSSVEPHLWVSMLHMLAPSLVLVADSLLERLNHALAADNLDAEILSLESLIQGPIRAPATSMSDVMALCADMLEHQRASEGESRILAAPVTPADTALIMFTSSPVDEGSIKAVRMNHASLLHGGQRIVRLFGEEFAKTPKRHLGWLPISHVFELYCGLFGHALHTGGSFVFFDASVSSLDAPAGLPLPELLLRAVDYHSPIQSMCAVPLIMDYVHAKRSEAHIATLQQLDAISAGGAPTSDDVWSWCRSQSIRIANLYGITEAAGGVAGRGLSLGDGFTLMDNLMGVIVKDDPEDDFGELLIVSEHIPCAYEIGHRDAFSPLPNHDGVTVYHTGDRWRIGSGFVGHVIIRGEAMPLFDTSEPMSGIYYMSRVDDTVVLASGIKVDALALEHILDTQDEIARSAIVLSKSKEQLLALIEPSSSYQTQAEAVKTAVLRVNLNLPYEKRVQRENIVLVDSLPLTTKATLHRKQVNKILSSNGDAWPLDRTIKPSATTNGATTNGTQARDVEPTSSAIPKGMKRTMQGIIAEIFSVPVEIVQGYSTLSDLPMSSLAVVRVAQAISDAFDCQIKAADLYGVQTINELCSRILSEKSPASHAATQNGQYPATVNVKSAGESDSLVISGASCRFPNGIRSLDDFWEVLLNPGPYVKTLSRPAPSSRWDTSEPGSDLPMAWLADEDFNNADSLASFFGISPTDAKAIPPNSRLVLQMAYCALEDAGIAPKSLSGRPWGVFTSMNDSGWKEQQLLREDSSGKARLWYTAAEASAGARLSYHLNLTGPSMEIKTACSSSAVAIHQACMAIRNGDCEGAIVVASTTFFAAPTAIFRMQAGIGSASGRCATFSDNADGFLPSEGTAAIVIQRAKDAPGPYYGKIRGSAVVQDGRSLGFSAPNPEAQVRLLKAGLKNAACSPDDVSYIEAHGTGTPVGDVVEFNSIQRVYSHSRSRPLVVGSVKAVLGHTEECAGLAGVLKSILCFKHGIIPPQPHIRSLNPEIDLEKSKAVIPRSVYGFSSGSRKRIVSVSSFGLSGTLGNIILEEPGELSRPSPRNVDRRCLFTLSARSEGDFRALLSRYAQYCESAAVSETSLEDACRTTQLGRDHFLYRRAWSVTGWRDLRLNLQSPQATQPARALNSPTVAIWFTLPHSSQNLPRISHDIFEAFMQECRTNGCTPALEPFAAQIALARTLQHLGCRVNATGGEGVAEYCAASLAGIISLQTLFGLLGALEPVPGHSWVVDLPREDLDEYLLDYPPDEVRIVGGGDNTSYIHARSFDSEMIREDVGTSHFKAAHTFTCASYRKGAHPRIRTLPPTMEVVSGYVGDVLDEEYLSERYWLELPQQTFDATKAQRRLAVSRDVVLQMSPQPCALQETQTVDVGKGLEGVLGKLYELGFPIDWRLYASPGPTCHLPAYVWASESL